jgi:hypothetical protein
MQRLKLAQICIRIRGKDVPSRSRRRLALLVSQQVSHVVLVVECSTTPKFQTCIKKQLEMSVFTVLMF